MSWFKKKEPNFYEREYARLMGEIERAKAGTAEYDRLMAELKDLQTFLGKEKERKQFLTKEGRGNIFGKIIGFVGLGGLAWGICRFEGRGGLFCGEKKEIISSVTKLASRLFL